MKLILAAALCLGPIGSWALTAPPSVEARAAARRAPSWKMPMLEKIDGWGALLPREAGDGRFDRFGARLKEIRSRVVAARVEPDLAAPRKDFQEWKAAFLWIKYAAARGAGLTTESFPAFCAREAQGVKFSLALSRGMKQMKEQAELARRSLQSSAFDENGKEYFPTFSAAGVSRAGGVPASRPSPRAALPDSARRYEPLVRLLHSRGVPEQLVRTVIQISRKNNVNPLVALAIIQSESNFKKYATSYDVDAQGRKVPLARGYMQLTAAHTPRGKTVDDLYDTQINLNGGMSYLSWIDHFLGGATILGRMEGWIDTGSQKLRSLIAAYNAGPWAVKKAGGVPAYRETIGYVRRVIGYIDQFQDALRQRAAAPASA